MLRVLCALLLLSGGCDACGGKPVARGADPDDEPIGALPVVAAPAVLEGVVRLAEGAALPSYAADQMFKKVLQQVDHAVLPDSCAPPKTTDRQPVQLTAEGLLAGMLVAASDFSRQPQRPPMLHEVIIEDCRLTPRLVVAMKGDQLRVRNGVDYPFMPAYGDTPVVRTLIRGQTYDTTLEKASVSPVLCGFTAPCGRADVVVMLHPVYVISDAQGKFRFENFPAGEEVKLSAWHPLFREVAIQVRVAPGETKRVELIATPLAAPPADPAPATPAPTR